MSEKIYLRMIFLLVLINCTILISVMVSDDYEFNVVSHNTSYEITDEDVKEALIRDMSDEFKWSLSDDQIQEYMDAMTKKEVISVSDVKNGDAARAGLESFLERK